MNLIIAKCSMCSKKYPLIKMSAKAIKSETNLIVVEKKKEAPATTYHNKKFVDRLTNNNLMQFICEECNARTF